MDYEIIIPIDSNAFKIKHAIDFSLILNEGIISINAIKNNILYFLISNGYSYAFNIKDNNISDYFLTFRVLNVPGGFDEYYDGFSSISNYNFEIMNTFEFCITPSDMSYIIIFYGIVISSSINEVTFRLFNIKEDAENFAAQYKDLI